MKIRLNKVQKELNIGLSTIVEFLQKKGFEIKEDPNAVVPEGGYEMLMQEFSADKKARIQSDNFTNERQNKSGGHIFRWGPGGFLATKLGSVALGQLVPECR